MMMERINLVVNCSIGNAVHDR